jgi:hypothetical protein
MIAEGAFLDLCRALARLFNAWALLLPAAVCKSNAGLHAKACFQEEPDPAIAI